MNCNLTFCPTGCRIQCDPRVVSIAEDSIRMISLSDSLSLSLYSTRVRPSLSVANRVVAGLNP